MSKPYPQRVRQTDQRITLHLNIPLADVPAEGATVFFQGLCKQIIAAEGWEPCREPALQVVRRAPSHLILECLIDLFPPITLPSSLAITVEAPPMDTPQPEEIMGRVEALQLRFGQTQTVDRPAQWGDMVRIDAVGLCQGELVPQSVQHNMWLSLQAKNGPLAAGLIGAQAGTQHRIAYTLPEDFAYAPWQGTSATYVVAIREVQSLQVPVVSALPLLWDQPQVHDEDSLFAALHAEQREAHQAQWQIRLRQRVLNTLLKAAPVEVPPPWIDESLQALWQATDAQHLAAIEAHLELSPQEHTAVFKNGFNSWQKHSDLPQKTRQDLAYQLLLRAVVKAHKLPLSETQITQALSGVGAPLHLTAEQVWAHLQAGQEDQRFLNQLMLDQAERYLIQQARIRYGEEVLRVA